MFYKNLESLEKISKEFINKGIYIVPILIFHELFRYSYPIESYTNFRHENQKLFIEELFSKLLNFVHSSDCFFFSS